MLAVVVLWSSTAMAEDMPDSSDVGTHMTDGADVDLSPKGNDVTLEKNFGNDTSVGVGSLGKGDAFPKESAPNVEPPSKYDPKDNAGGVYLKKEF
jgi:hypothetical protein